MDRARALEVLENLTANAVRFSPPGGVVTLGLAADGPAVVLTISDQGSGMAKSALPTLFRSVGFAGGRRRAPGSGSGLGLYLVGKLVRELGGGVACESRPGAGTTFTVRLPLLARNSS